MTTRKVLVTGAGGFVGAALVRALRCDPLWNVIECVRPGAVGAAESRYFDLKNPSPLPNLDDIDTVVHAAARVHVMNETAIDAWHEFQCANVAATLELARHSQAAGVRRFIYISSIKVNGESTFAGQSFHADDIPSPQDLYGRSKAEAEAGLRGMVEHGGMEVVIIRPPLVYGPEVRANFLSMMKWVARGVPLPLGRINNRRSLVYLPNLIDFIKLCMVHPDAANQTWLVADATSMSTSDLLRALASAAGKPSRLIPVPCWLLQAFAVGIGKGAMWKRLAGSLEVDIKKNRACLGWTPPVATSEGLEMTMRCFLEQSV